jgi:hypothetical protein
MNMEIAGVWPVHTCSGDFQSSAAHAKLFGSRHIYVSASIQVLAGAQRDSSGIDSKQIKSKTNDRGSPINIEGNNDG